MIKTKHCSACKIVKNADQFSPDRSKASGLASRCRPCDNVKSTNRYHRAHPGSRRRGPHGDVVGYYGAHGRLRRVLGSASARRCAHCDQPARDWAYDHQDPDELTAEVNGCIVPYSLDPAHYMPLCKRCHNKLDHP